MKTSVRSFLALELPESIRAELARLGEALRRSSPEFDRAVTWVKPESLHLTLVFLGSVDAQVLDRLREQLAPSLKVHAPFTLSLSGTGSFPQGKPPRVLWVGLAESASRSSKESASPLQSMRREVMSVCASLELANEEGLYTPHLTIGRVRDNLGRATRANLAEAWIALASKVALLSWPVDAISLMKSETLPSGARYTRLAELPLGEARSDS